MRRLLLLASVAVFVDTAFYAAITPLLPWPGAAWQLGALIVLAAPACRTCCSPRRAR